MSTGWAVCFDTPFVWTKQVASNYGGTRQGTVIHWPEGIKAKGELRSQWHHVIDIAPTIIEKTHYGVWSFDESANVGIDRETPVSPDYNEETSKFTGKIDKVTINLKK